MREPRTCTVLITFALLLSAHLAVAQQPAPADASPPLVREIYVPFEDLNVLLEASPQRVYLGRDEYKRLLAQSKRPADVPPPIPAVLQSSEYSLVIEDGRARLSGEVVIEVLDEGLQAIPLDLSGVGLRTARLDDSPAALGRASDGKVTLFVEGQGRHVLKLEMTAPLATSAAQQSLAIRLPSAATHRLKGVAPGNVELKSGAQVLKREVTESPVTTEFELSAPGGPLSLVFSLNNRVLQDRRVVLARSVLIDEVAIGIERLTATVSMQVLHGATDQFEFDMPADFEVIDVTAEQLARWSTEPAEGGMQRVTVELQQAVTETCTIRLAAVRLGERPERWTFPHVTPRDTAGHLAVLGLMVEQAMRLHDVAEQELIAIDLALLAEPFAAATQRGQGEVRSMRPLLAYYAPTPGYELSGKFERTPQQLEVVTNLVLQLHERRQELLGVFSLRPKIEKLFELRFRSAPGWEITSVRDAEGNTLPFERFSDEQGARIRVRLPRAIEPGEAFAVEFSAHRIPDGWLEPWTEQQVEFPDFAVEDAARESGALALELPNDLVARPEQLEQLSPLNDDERAEFGLSDAIDLALRFDQRPYAASFRIERKQPNLTARSVSFFRIEKTGLHAYYEVEFTVREATTRRLRFALPVSTPAEVTIRGVGNSAVKEATSSVQDGERRWDVLLAENIPLDDQQLGRAVIGITFQQSLAEPFTDFELPQITAVGVEHQSGLLAVEGDAELQTRVVTVARRVDIGELSSAQYEVGRHLLGAYGYVGEPPEVRVYAERPALHALPAAIVERAELWTIFTPNGHAQTTARLQLRTAALLLEIELPEGAELWSVLVDDTPATPQRAGSALLVNLLAAPERPLRQIDITYGFPVRASRLWGRIRAEAPQLRLATEGGAEARRVPIADVHWRMLLPKGYRLSKSNGTVAPVSDVERPHPFRLATEFYRHLFAAMDTQMPTRAGAEPAEALVESLTLDDAASMKSAAPETAPFASSGAPLEFTAPRPELESASGEASNRRKFGTFEDTTPPANLGDSLRARRPADEPAQQAGPGRGVDSLATGRDGTLALMGVRSLRVDMQRAFQHADAQQIAELQSLGDDPQISVRVVHHARIVYAAWATGLLVGLIGLRLTGAPWRWKLGFIGVIVMLAFVLPAMAGGLHELELLAEAAVLATMILLPFYVVLDMVRHFVRSLFRHVFAGRWLVVARAVSIALVICVLLALVFSSTANAQDVVNVEQLLNELNLGPAVALPEDAILIPYDPDKDLDPREQAEQILVPYATYVELWNRANPDRPIGERPLPTEVVIGNAKFHAVLEDDDDLAIDGTITIESFVDGPAVVRLPFAGGVLLFATLDGQPARLQILTADAQQDPPPQISATIVPAPPVPPAMLSLVVSGRGSKQLELKLRLKLERQGGWRRAEAMLPMGAVGELSLTAAQPQTEVRLSGVADKAHWELADAGERIETALLPATRLNLKWRPKVAEGQVDAALTANSSIAVDVQPSGINVAWQLELAFGRGRRDVFHLGAPEGFLIQRVLGDNVRGWTAETQEGRQRIRVELLRAASGREQITLLLSRDAAAAKQQATKIDVPVLTVEDAALVQGTIAIRRSAMLNLRTLRSAGLQRTQPDSAAAEALMSAAGAPQPPLPMIMYQVLRFSSANYSLELESQTAEPQVNAELRAIWRISERQMTFEAQFVIHTERAPLHRAVIDLPTEFQVERVSEPEHAVTEFEGGRRLTVYLGEGRTGSFTLTIAGTLGDPDLGAPLNIPVVRLNGAQRQSGQLVVQVDPAFRVRAEKLSDSNLLPLEQTSQWLAADQRELARSGLALELRSTDYRGRLVLERREPLVRYTTLSNVHLTRRALEETVLIEWQVERAGIQQLRFLLPARMAAARIRVPALRHRTVEPGFGTEDDPRVRVTLELQDELMDTIRVIIEHDQVLSTDPHPAPIPIVETGEPLEQYVTIQNSSRDEVIVVDRVAMNELARQQNRWRRLADLDATLGFIVQRGADKSKLVVQTQPRKALETVGARIGLAETVLTVDSSGAYRAVQQLRVENSTLQFLEIALPDGAELWTVHVAGQPVKPAEPDNDETATDVRIPLVKTQAGDADYPVRIVYAGQLDNLSSLQRVSFPIARTVNVNVELSQLTLYLPDSQRWFNFRGARRLDNRADYAQGYESYFESQLLKVSRAISSGSEFDRQRARQNLTELEKHLDANRDQFALLYRSNSKLAAQNLANLQLLAEARSQLQEEASSTDTAQIDNREILYETFKDQRYRRATNIAANNRMNFAYEAPSEVPVKLTPEGEPRFDKRWFHDNKLSSIPGSEAPEQQMQQQQQPATSPRIVINEPVKDLKQLGAGIQMRRSLERADSESSAKSNGEQAEPSSQMAAVPQGDGGAEVQEFGRAAQAEQRTDRPSLSFTGPQAGPALPYDPSVQADGLGGEPPPAVVTGLASLELAVPQRGAVFYFRAARGELNVSAQTIATGEYYRTVRIAIGTALAIALAFVLRKKRRN